MFESITSRRKKQQVFVILVLVLCKKWRHFSLLRLQIRSKSTLYYRNCPEKVTENQYSKAALPSISPGLHRGEEQSCRSQRLSLV